MKSPKIDENGDLVFLNGDVVWVDGAEEIVQSVTSIIQTRKGEWFLNDGFGLSHEHIFVKSPDLNMIEDDLREAIGQEERITEITDIELVIQPKRILQTKVQMKAG
ncbi:DUF2634 domain-containing protein [Burkholderia pseudomallei]|nr:DUF2634 domain-containing protein [Burkholderia pseudomallei]